MMIADNGGAINPTALVNGVTSNTRVSVYELSKAGFTPVVTEVAAGDIAALSALIEKGGPAMIGAGDEVLGGHEIIVDHIDMQNQNAVIRDPWHGWSVRTTLDALRLRIPLPFDAVQVDGANIPPISPFKR
jgi:hypothetical protein